MPLNETPPWKFSAYATDIKLDINWIFKLNFYGKKLTILVEMVVQEDILIFGYLVHFAYTLFNLHGLLSRNRVNYID